MRRPAPASRSCPKTGASLQASRSRKTSSCRRSRLTPGWDLDRIYAHFPRLAERRRQEGITLSGGEQQMLAVARALARDVKLLLLDEPYEGLAPQIVAEIEEILIELKKVGTTVIVVEQNAVAALRIADTCTILDNGELRVPRRAARGAGEPRAQKRLPRRRFSWVASRRSAVGSLDAGGSVDLGRKLRSRHTGVETGDRSIVITAHAGS